MTADTHSFRTSIHIPEKLIPLLKEFTKTVIRQQPEDLLTWSEKYFRNRAITAKRHNSTTSDRNMIPDTLASSEDQ